MGAEHQPHKRIAVPDAAGHRLLLHHAAAQGDQQARFPAFQGFERPDIAEHPVLRVLPHGTGVEQDEIRFLRRSGEPEPHPGQQALHVFGIGDVLLAAVSTHAGERGRPFPYAVKLPDLADEAFLLRQLLRRNGSHIGHSGEFSFFEAGRPPPSGIREQSVRRRCPIGLL